MIDAKPAKRFRASPAEWERLHAEFAPYRCVCCGQTWDSLHHVYPRGQGGDDVYANLVPLCGSGTTGCHGLVELRDPFARSLIRAWVDERPECLGYLRYRIGETWEAWLDKNYSISGAGRGQQHADQGSSVPVASSRPYRWPASGMADESPRDPLGAA